MMSDSKDIIVWTPWDKRPWWEQMAHEAELQNWWQQQDQDDAWISQQVEER